MQACISFVYTVLFLIFLLISRTTMGEEFVVNSGVIEKIRFYPAERPEHTGYQNIALIHLSSGTVSGESGLCETSEFAVLNSDETLISSLLTARITGMTISLAIEKDFTHGNGNFCRIVKVEM